MEKKMKSYHQKFVSDHPYESSPMAEIAGFPVRPGIYDLNGATPLQNGVNFTIHTCGGTSCELLLFHRAQEEPFAVLPFPEAPQPSNSTITGILCSFRVKKSGEKHTMMWYAFFSSKRRYREAVKQ